LGADHHAVSLCGPGLGFDSEIPEPEVARGPSYGRELQEPFGHPAGDIGASNIEGIILQMSFPCAETYLRLDEPLDHSQVGQHRRVFCRPQEDRPDNPVPFLDQLSVDGTVRILKDHALASAFLPEPKATTV